MQGINKVILVGTLGRDPEIHHTSSGDSITNISIATSEKWIDKTSGESSSKTEWHKIVLFKRLAEIAGEYLKKGSKIYLEGKLQTRKWTDNNGNDRYTTEIIAQNMQMIDSKKAETGENNENNEDDDIPF